MVKPRDSLTGGFQERWPGGETWAARRLERARVASAVDREKSLVAARAVIDVLTVCTQVISALNRLPRGTYPKANCRDRLPRPMKFAR